MTGWPRHALALAVLALLSFGLFGRLYSPLDHAYPEGEARSAAVTRFIAENPNPWGWNPTWGGGEPTQTELRPTFHYSAALLAKLGNEPLYAHRIVAVTIVLLGPLAVYGMAVTLGMPWVPALAAAIALQFLSPFAIYRRPLITFLPTPLMYLEHFGDGPDLAGLVLVWVALATVWRAAHNRQPLWLLLAAISIAMVLLCSGAATSALAIVLMMMELAMLGIAGEYRFSHRRVFAAIAWAFLLSIFAFAGGSTYSPLIPSFYGLSWGLALAGAVVIRLLFLGRRQPFLCLVTMGVWVFACFAEQMSLTLEVFWVLAIFAWLGKILERSSKLYRVLAVAPALLLLGRYDPWEHRYSAVRLDSVRAQVKEWQGDWGMRRPSESEEFRLTQWFVTNPPRGRILTSREHLLGLRMNSWVSFAQSRRPGQLNPNGLNQYGHEYLVTGQVQPEYPVAVKIGNSIVYRLPFQSLAMSIMGGKKGPPLELTWLSSSKARITGQLPKDHTIRIEIFYYPGWQSSIPINKGSDGLMNMAPPAGDVALLLEYQGTQEQHFFGYLSAFVWVASLGYVGYRSWRR